MLASTVTTYGSADGLESVLETMAAELEECPPTSKYTLGDYVYALKFRKAPDLRGIDADQQLNYVATGTLRDPDGGSVPLTWHISHVRVGTSIASVHIHSGFTKPAQFQRAAVKVAVGRLVAITRGEEPPKAKVPSPGP